jgi:virulence-associated protein VagC
MKFNRKLIKRSGLYGSITIPPEVLSEWPAVDQVEMTFDGTCLVITPIKEDLK